MEANVANMGWAHIHTLWFAEFCRSIGDGFALEAALKFKGIQEEQNTDRGPYKNWSDVLSHFNGDVSKATDFVRLRRKQPRGTSTNRNDSEETFLRFKDEVRVFILPPPLRYDPDIHKTLFKGLLELELKTLKLH